MKRKNSKSFNKRGIPKVYLEGFKLIQDKIDESNFKRKMYNFYI